MPAIEVALGRFTEMRALEAENASLADDKKSLEQQLETRRWVDRAKGRLMDEHGMKEAEAFSFIQQTAMNRRATMRDVAALVMDGDLAP
jgi:response regulator NasT